MLTGLNLKSAEVKGSHVEATSGMSSIVNGSATEPETELPDPLTTVSVLLIGVFLSLLIFLSVAGNILVCVAIYTDRGLRKIGNLFLASLAISDLFVACLVMTFAVVNDLLGYWVFGEQFCDTWIAFDVMCSTASILNLCAISLDRYIHIKDPLRYGRWINKKVILISIACIWLLAGLISFLPISLDLHKPWEPLPDEPGYPTCALDLSPTYAVVSSCISFYLPCAVMLAIYCRLYLYARRHVQNIRAVTRPMSFGATDDMPTSSSSSSYHVSDHKAAITIGVIMGVFLICWVPFFCVNIIAAFCKTCIPDMAFKILTWLGYSNSAFNPVIYSIFNTEFREAFKRILTSHYPASWCFCCCCCCPGNGGKCGYQAVSTTSVGRRSQCEPDPDTGSLRQVNGTCIINRDGSPRSSACSTTPTPLKQVACGGLSPNQQVSCV